jgi:hypothetical protein
VCLQDSGFSDPGTPQFAGKTPAGTPENAHELRKSGYSKLGWAATADAYGDDAPRVNPVPDGLLVELQTVGDLRDGEELVF